MNFLFEDKEGVRLNLRCIPRAAGEKIDGTQGDALKVRIQSPPQDGKANAAVIKLLSKTLGVSRRQIRILRGEKSRDKTLLVSGISRTDLQQRLAPFL